MAIFQPLQFRYFPVSLNIPLKFSTHTHTQRNFKKKMSTSLSLPIINGGILFSASKLSFSNFPSSSGRKWDSQREQRSLFSQRTRSQPIRVLANPNVSSSKGSSKKEVFMVDPLEAKRLAAKQMEKIKAKEKFEKRRQIEAINGAWAMIGLTAGLVIEGRTGNSILAQLAGYWAALTGIFVRF